MGLITKIRLLCDDKKVTFAEVERNIGISNGQIRRWDKTSPNSETLKKVADYFDVSTDYLLGRTEQKRYYDLNDKDEKTVQRELENILNNFGESGFAAADGSTLDELDPEDRELLIASLEQSLRIAKSISKRKFTPKKYRD